jgi:hypothetical protein
MGIFGNHGEGVIWLHLAECYLQLEKYPTAEKCLKQALAKFNEAFPDVPTTTVYLINRGAVDGSLLSDVQEIIHPFAQAGLLNDEQKTILAKIMDVFAKKREPSF